MTSLYQAFGTNYIGKYNLSEFTRFLGGLDKQIDLTAIRPNVELLDLLTSNKQMIYIDRDKNPCLYYSVFQEDHDQKLEVIELLPEISLWKSIKELPVNNTKVVFIDKGVAPFSVGMILKTWVDTNLTILMTPLVQDTLSFILSPIIKEVGDFIGEDNTIVFCDEGKLHKADVYDNIVRFYYHRSMHISKFIEKFTCIPTVFITGTKEERVDYIGREAYDSILRGAVTAATSYKDLTEVKSIEDYIRSLV